jgi:hypothetical protein
MMPRNELIRQQVPGHATAPGHLLAKAKKNRMANPSAAGPGGEPYFTQKFGTYPVGPR